MNVLGAQHKFSAFVQIVFLSKKRRSSLSRKSGRHMGVERPYVLGHFEVKPLNRGCLATFSDPKRERVFLNRMPTICPGQTRGHMTYETERIWEIAMFPDALLGLCGVSVLDVRDGGIPAQPSHVVALVSKQESLRNRWTSQAFKTNWWRK